MPIPFLVGRKNKLYTKLAEKFLYKISDKNIKLITPYLKGKKILDIGVGAGVTYRLLQGLNYQMQGIDVADLSMYDDILPVIYDGQNIPFEKNQFDTSLLIHVLHHCGSNQVSVLKEAARTSRRIVIVEDTYKNLVEKIITNINDRLGNFEFYSHPYHTIAGWQKLFVKNNLKLIKTIDFYRRPWYFPFPVHYVLFVIE